MIQSDLVVLEEPECIDSGHVASQVHHLSSKILSGRTSRSRWKWRIKAWFDVCSADGMHENAAATRAASAPPVPPPPPLDETEGGQGVTMRCTLPHGIKIRPSTRYGGYGLFSASCVQPYEVLYRATSRLIPQQTGEARLLTHVDESRRVELLTMSASNECDWHPQAPSL